MSVTRTIRLLAVAATLVVPVAQAADQAKGKTLFEQRCGICHSDKKEEGGPVVGPNLVGVIGRKAGSVKEFQLYTSGLKAYGEKEKWSAKTLDKFLKDPFGTVPGTSMSMPVPDDKERADVIAYLGTLK